MIGSDLEGADLEGRLASRGGYWKITQYMDQQLPEQSRRGLLRRLASPPPGSGHVLPPLRSASTKRRPRSR